MTIYIAVMYDRHVDDTYSVHRTLEEANKTVDEFIASYNGEYGEWQEEDWGAPNGLDILMAGTTMGHTPLLKLPN